jgi:hypothetical protein
MIKDFSALAAILLIVAILLFWTWVISEGVL